MSQMSPSHVYLVADEAPPQPHEIVRDILHESGSLSRLMEVLYFAEEPGLLEIMRCLTALPDEQRFRLLQYLTRHREHHMYMSDLPSGALIIETVEDTPLDENG